MIREDQGQLLIAECAPPPEPVDTFEAAIAKITELTLALFSANAELVYGVGARIRGELERALSIGQTLAERLVEGAARAEALHQLGEMHRIATEALMAAPAPSSAAVAALENGDPAQWNQEEQAWITARLANAARPRPPEPRRDRRPTQPESPKARRDSSEDLRVSADATSRDAAGGPDHEDTK